MNEKNLIYIKKNVTPEAKRKHQIFRQSDVSAFYFSRSDRI